jgi:hypothetical protein
MTCLSQFRWFNYQLILEKNINFITSAFYQYHGYKRKVWEPNAAPEWRFQSLNLEREICKTLILYSHLLLGLPSGLFFLGVSTKTLCALDEAIELSSIQIK